MPESIRDGKGRGYLAEVTEENRIKVSSVQRSKEHHANNEHGKAFDIIIEATPTGAGDCFFYLKNTLTNSVILEEINIYCAADEKIYVQFNDVGTPSGGSDITPANLNAGSSEVLTGTIQSGADITGLSGGTKVWQCRLEAGKCVSKNFAADLVIPPQKVVTFWATTGTALIEAVVPCWIEEGGA